jgi:subtilisin-like proprotein convertase family protein
MKTIPSLIPAAACLLSAHSAAFSAPSTPSRVSSGLLTQLPYRTSGVIWGNGWRGSGTVARDPKIAVSCAHLVFEDGTWLRGFDWANAHHSASHPSTSPNRQTLRGYWYWTSYTGGTSGSAFAQDFVVHYAYNNLAQGAYAGWWWHDSTTAHPLASTTTSKLIVGYPGSDAYYQNSTGSFTSRYTSRSAHYLWNSSVKGGSGMSGGGVYARYGTEWRLAGVHVSGLTSGGPGAGARALNKNSYDLMTRAIASSKGTTTVSTTRTFGSFSPLSIPDNSSAWSFRIIPVTGMPTTLTSVKISVNLTHTYQGDLQMTLTSPAGRSVTLHDRSGGSADNILITDLDLSTSFAGTTANGTWSLSVRDVDGGDVGTLNSVNLTLGAR